MVIVKLNRHFKFVENLTLANRIFNFDYNHKYKP